jgi:peroxiredoxin
MRTATIAVLTASLTFSALAGGPALRKAPEFVILSPNGKQTLLSSYRGKDVVLAFMFTTCPHCQKSAPQFARLQDEYGAKGVQFLAATFDPEAKTQVENFVRVFGVNFPCGYSSEENVLRFLGLPPKTPVFVPMVIFIDRTGTIRAQHMMTGDAKKDESENQFFADVGAGSRVEIEKMLKAEKK